MARRTLSLDEHDHFEIDEADRLYFKGRQVLLEQKISLGAFERFLALCAAAATVLAALFPIGAHFGWW